MKYLDATNQYNIALNIGILTNLTIVFLTLGKVDICKIYHKQVMELLYDLSYPLKYYVT